MVPELKNCEVPSILPKQFRIKELGEGGGEHAEERGVSSPCGLGLKGMRKASMPGGGW